MVQDTKLQRELRKCAEDPKTATGTAEVCRKAAEAIGLLRLEVEDRRTYEVRGLQKENGILWRNYCHLLAKYAGVSAHVDGIEPDIYERPAPKANGETGA